MSLEEQRSESGKETGALLRSWDNSSLEEDTPKQGHPSRCCCHLDHNRRRSRLSFQCSAILLASLALLILILVLTVPSWFRTSSTGARHLRPDTPGLNKYFQLAEYTATWQLEGDEGSGESTAEAAQLWADILDTDGIVAIPHTWAQQQGLPPSDPHPDRPDHGVYQIDLWHSLHCLFRIRNRIVYHVPIDEHPRDDGHTLHCVDYIRQQLMCHADTTLQEGLSNTKIPNQCKDFGVIQGWVRDHGWPGYREYMWPIMAAEAEREKEAASHKDHSDSHSP